MIRGSDIPLIFGVTALALGAASFLWLGTLEWRLRKLFRGRAMGSLEHLMQEMVQELEHAAQKHTEVDEALAHIETRLRQSAQNVGLVRFNPYSDGGGDQSFALAVLNEHQNGFTISSLFHRDGTRIYAKPIIKSNSTYPLSAEEREAIERALAHNR